MEPPRYVADEADLAERGRAAKQWDCPHCGRAGQVNGHGWLRGHSESGHDKRAVRGRRFFCSNRGRRRGCGRTFSVWRLPVIAGASVRSGTLWRFYQTKLSGTSVAHAWAGLRSVFSLEAAYRWWRRWRRGEPTLRTAVSRGRAPPAEALALALPALYGAIDPIGGFQCREQRDWP